MIFIYSFFFLAWCSKLTSKLIYYIWHYTILDNSTVPKTILVHIMLIPPNLDSAHLYVSQNAYLQSPEQDAHVWSNTDLEQSLINPLGTIIQLKLESCNLFCSLWITKRPWPCTLLPSSSTITILLNGHKQEALAGPADGEWWFEPGCWQPVGSFYVTKVPRGTCTKYTHHSTLLPSLLVLHSIDLYGFIFSLTCLFPIPKALRKMCIQNL